jgi:hypothetical protein
VRVSAACDRPCTITVSGRGGAIRRPATRVLRDHTGGAATLTARARGGGRATIVVTAQGAPGADASVKRTLKLR